MKYCIVFLFLSVFSAYELKAQEIDLLSDELTSSSSTEEVGDNTKDTEKSGAVYSYIIKPIVNFFNSDEEIIREDGKKETYLERSIRQANEGNVEDQKNLAYLYLYGSEGVEQNLAEAFKYYDMAAKQDDPIALNNLGSLYFSGLGTKKDTKKALQYFERAAQLGNDSAAVNLAFINLQGGFNDMQRNKKAIDLFDMASQKGNKIAKFMLGYAYYKGFIVPQDYIKAFKLVNSSAQGDARIDEAQIVLADMYTNGYGTVQNYGRAISAYRAAVGQGNLEAIMKLANIYEEGTICPPNLIHAHALYNVAAAQNIAGAAEKREEIKSKLNQETLSQAQEIAQNYKAEVSELTDYIRKTYGNNIRSYIDKNMKK